MFRKTIQRFVKNESGAAMVEYAIALLVAAGLGIGTFTAMGDQAAFNSNKACTVLTGDGISDGGAAASC